MSAQNPYNKMIDNMVMTASKEELTLMLYEGAIKFCNQAITAINDKDFMKANLLLIRVQDIIREFQITLRRDNEISRYFDAMYEYMYRRLVEANYSKDVAIVEEVLGLTREFRDTWKEAMRLAKTS
uniref:Flagellar biosynthesis protein FliS n=1 Tax=uncultured bacterium contig00034 TaxID=1181523 RepID=A0A806KH54_9BACT|nr:flagellar biosynthesis protein FliS [uncultured bacterium contig00034]